MDNIVSVSRRVDVIEAMRGVAALAVALFHFTHGLTSPVMTAIGSVGWLGVDVFFVISGFVIPLSLWGRNYGLRDFPKFMLRRLVRLEPAYLASIVLVIVLWHASALAPGFRGHEASYSTGQVLSHLFYVVPLTGYTWLSPVYWTLAYEFVFYIVIGLSFPFLFRRPVEFTILFAVIAIAALTMLTGRVNPRLLEFLIGILLMRGIAQRESRSLFWAVIALALLFCFGGIHTAAAAALAAGVIFFFQDSRLGSWATALGAISYSLYLTHTTIGGRVMNLGRRFVDGALGEVVLVMIAVVVSIAFAVVFFRLFEAPALAASRRIRVAAFAN
jgi:peptidoglycan/LPS O-acetylase OafA/YrhL